MRAQVQAQAGTRFVPPVRRPGQAAQGWRGALSRPAVFGGLMPVVTILNALVGMALPKLMPPAEFGTYALVVTLFQYGLIFDLGASQLADRMIPACLGRGEQDDADLIGQHLLWLRLAVAAATLAVLVPGLFAASWLGALPFRPGIGALAATAGIAYMVSLGPACLYRAQAARRNYALSVVILSSGLIVARPGGLLASGIAGCFAALLAWYVGFALLFHVRLPPRVTMMPSAWRGAALLARGLPFFATSILWAFYVTGNRWFAAGLLPQESFGQFAFAANIFSLLVGAAGGFSAFYYPRLSQGIASGAAFALSGRLCRDCTKLVIALALLMAAGIVLAALLVGLAYPHYRAGVPTARIMLVAVPPLVLAAWLMPVSLSNGHKPWIDGLIVFPLATLLLGASERWLFALDGSAGAAAASTVSALPLVAMQLAVLRHARILRARHAAALLGATVLASAVLAALAVLVAQ